MKPSAKIVLSVPMASLRFFIGVGAALAALISIPCGRADSTIQVIPATTRAPFQGWGTSLCWFGNAVGRWSEPERSEIADLLFAPPPRGLGFTVARYNIGGGEAPEHHHMPTFRQMEGFESADGKWNWEADPGQRWFLQAAIQRGVTTLEAFSNSPPYWMTISQCVSGGGDGTTDNLDPRFHTAFAEYLAEVVHHFHDTWGISFQTIDPFNEPYTDYWKVNGKQEGCHFEHASQATMIKLLRDSLDRRKLTRVGISASDETNFDRAIGSFSAYDSATQALVAQINTHAYAVDRRSELHRLAESYHKMLVMSEVDGAGGAVHDHDSMVPPLELAARIIGDLRELHPTQWTFWQAVEDEASQIAGHKNWGLIHADLAGQSHSFTLTKKYYAMANFTRFIRPQQRFQSISDENSVSALDPATHTLIIVTRNADNTAVHVAFDLTRFAGIPKSVAIYRTSSTENLSRLPDAEIAGKKFSTTLSPLSLTTFVIADIASPDAD